MSGKRVFLGHTPQPFGHILDGGHVVCNDTCCFGGGFLTAYDLDTGDTIQANIHGHLRRAPASILVERLSRIGARLTRYYREKLARLNTDSSAAETTANSATVDSGLSGSNLGPLPESDS